MQASTIRLRKEARALFWPWLAVMAMAVLPLLLPKFPRTSPWRVLHATAWDLCGLAFWFGVPLLASLALENEFRQHTITLWLSQPCRRLELWREKMIASTAAVLSASAVIAMVEASDRSVWPSPNLPMMQLVYVVVALASAPYWILVARATLSGFVVGLTVNSCIFMAIVFSLEGHTMEAALRKSSAATLAMLAGATVLYAVGTLWLGARKLAAFQTRGGPGGDDLVVSGPTFLPEPLASCFRCRPRQPVRNLVRKELRLLRPLWLVDALLVGTLAVLALSRYLPVDPFRDTAPTDLPHWMAGMLILLFLCAAILAGSVALSEESASGILSWQMTWPISPRRQWLTKFAVALTAALMASVLLPLATLLVSGLLYRAPLLYLRSGSWLLWMFAVVFAVVTSFWSACAARDAVRAILLFFAATFTMSAATTAGLWLAGHWTGSTGTLRDLVVSSLHLNPSAFQIPAFDVTPAMAFFLPLADAIPRLFLIPAALFATGQSYRIYRAPKQDGMGWMLRCLAPLAMASLVGATLLAATLRPSSWDPLRETGDALLQLPPPAVVMEVSGDSLAGRVRVSPLTRRWLAGSRIAVLAERSSGYRTVIHLAGGVDCAVVAARAGVIRVSPTRPPCTERPDAHRASR
ncbi:MAG TPA: hypothetical protein VFU76_17045 [Terriglobales bacterium]|nr:hypothetical protein [Terriglobales bacterium]